MAVGRMIARGKLDYAPEDNRWLIRDTDISIGTLELDWLLQAHIGKTIIILVDETEEEPVLNDSLKELLVEA